jgi:anti-anti-sigma factor
MSQAFTITKTDGPVTVLHLDGHLDSQAEGQLVESVRQTQAAGIHLLVLDFSKVEMITSAGLRALHSIYKMFTPHDEMDAWQKAHEGEVYKSPYFKLAGVSPEVHYVLSIAGFLQNIPIYPTFQEAMDSFPK